MRIARSHQAGAASRRGAEHFTGDVWLDPIMPSEDGRTINNVFFTPGARTYWHFHERGQLLHVTLGNGFVCSRNGDSRIVAVGDVIWVPPGEEHWHGGTAECCMQHLAVSLGTTNWLEPVADEDYAAAWAEAGAAPASSPSPHERVAATEKGERR